MRASRLWLNPQKTQLIWLGSRQQLDKLNITDVQLLSTTLHPQSTVCSLGVILDSQLTMSSHITNLCRSGYYQLRQLRGMIQSLTPDTTKTLVHAFISSRLDYCNSLLSGIANQQLKRLQSVQNAAAHLVTGTRRSDHITPDGVEGPPLAASLAVHTVQNGDASDKCLNERAPEYLITNCCWAGSCRSGTRSAGRQMLEVVRMNMSFGDGSFAAAAHV